jgi:hypothetical protein
VDSVVACAAASMAASAAATRNGEAEGATHAVDTGADSDSNETNHINGCKHTVDYVQYCIL